MSGADESLTSETLASAKRGDKAAIATVWRLHQASLLRYLRSLGVFTAEDVASVVWIDVARALPALSDDEPTSFRRLLFTIARRRMIDEIRRRNHHPAIGPLDETLGAAEDVVPLGEAIALLRQLPVSQAEVIALRVIAGFSAEEVGEITGRTAGAVRVMAHRGLEHLRELLASEMGHLDRSPLTDVTNPIPQSINPTT